METIQTAKEILDKYEKEFKENGIVFNLTKPMIEFAKLHVLNELTKVIEHPNKPGYKRSDVINRIKEINNSNIIK